MTFSTRGKSQNKHSSQGNGKSISVGRNLVYFCRYCGKTTYYLRGAQVQHCCSCRGVYVYVGEFNLTNLVAEEAQRLHTNVVQL